MKNTSLFVITVLLLTGLVQSLVLVPVIKADTFEVNQGDECSITISPATATVYCGNEIQFATIPSGTCETPDYAWSIISRIGSTITQDGLYTAGISGCSGPYAIDIVRVTDTANGNIKATATVKVENCCLCCLPLTVEPDEGQQGQTYTVELSTVQMLIRKILLSTSGEA
jgi:hypothetical protein